MSSKTVHLRFIIPFLLLYLNNILSDYSPCSNDECSNIDLYNDGFFASSCKRNCQFSCNNLKQQLCKNDQLSSSIQPVGITCGSLGGIAKDGILQQVFNLLLTKLKLEATISNVCKNASALYYLFVLDSPLTVVSLSISNQLMVSGNLTTLLDLQSHPGGTIGWNETIQCQSNNTSNCSSCVVFQLPTFLGELLVFIFAESCEGIMEYEWIFDIEPSDNLTTITYVDWNKLIFNVSFKESNESQQNFTISEVNSRSFQVTKILYWYRDGTSFSRVTSTASPTHSKRSSSAATTTSIEKATFSTRWSTPTNFSQTTSFYSSNGTTSPDSTTLLPSTSTILSTITGINSTTTIRTTPQSSSSSSSLSSSSKSSSSASSTTQSSTTETVPTSSSITKAMPTSTMSPTNLTFLTTSELTNTTTSTSSTKPSTTTLVSSSPSSSTSSKTSLQSTSTTQSSSTSTSTSSSVSALTSSASSLGPETSKTDMGTSTDWPGNSNFSLDFKLTQAEFRNSFSDTSSLEYKMLNDSIYPQLFAVCNQTLPGLFMGISNITFKKGSIVVNSTLDLAGRLSPEEEQKLRDNVDKASSNWSLPTFPGPLNVVAVAIGCVLGFLCLLIICIIIILIYRRRLKTRRHPDPVSPEAEDTGFTPIPRPPPLLWQSSTGTSSLSRRNHSNAFELSISGVALGESYVGVDDDGIKMHQPDTVRVRNGFRDPALKHFGEFSKDGHRAPWRSDSKSNGQAGQWSGQIPRPGLGSRFEPNGSTETSGSFLKTGNKWGQKQTTPFADALKRRTSNDPDDTYFARRQPEAKEPGVPGHHNQVMAANGPVPVDHQRRLLESIESNSPSPIDATKNHSENSFFPNNKGIFSNLRPPVFNPRPSLSPFETPLSMSTGPEKVVEADKGAGAFEGLFVPTLSTSRPSTESSTEQLLTEHWVSHNNSQATGPDKTIDQDISPKLDDVFSDVLTFHGSKRNSQPGFFSRFAASAQQQDNIHRTPKRQQLKTRSQLSMANVGDMVH